MRTGVRGGTVANDIIRNLHREMKKLGQTLEKELEKEMKRHGAGSVTIHLPDGKTTTLYANESSRHWRINPAERSASTDSATTSTDAEDTEAGRRFAEWLKANTDK
jgi:hypothetical protein